MHTTEKYSARNEQENKPIVVVMRRCHKSLGWLGLGVAFEAIHSSVRSQNAPRLVVSEQLGELLHGDSIVLVGTPPQQTGIPQVNCIEQFGSEVLVVGTHTIDLEATVGVLVNVAQAFVAVTGSIVQGQHGTSKLPAFVHSHSLIGQGHQKGLNFQSTSSRQCSIAKLGVKTKSLLAIRVAEATPQTIGE